ncbi:MAG: TilS substrate-binding domain-containing protein [Cyanobacteria bacterium NC_groundwater_1444_Ag_S-0.65um_54_12]|nr:TilS substrate-binding domain-containing protein [Cyanobacteria bacterium NC_groundwater_1444_Ag_S-0.65um_54_12]
MKKWRKIAKDRLGAMPPAEAQDAIRRWLERGYLTTIDYQELADWLTAAYLDPDNSGNGVARQ